MPTEGQSLTINTEISNKTCSILTPNKKPPNTKNSANMSTKIQNL